jgi:hypothetical protein
MFIVLSSVPTALRGNEAYRRLEKCAKTDSMYSNTN